MAPKRPKETCRQIPRQVRKHAYAGPLTMLVGLT